MRDRHGSRGMSLAAARAPRRPRSSTSQAIERQQALTRERDQRAAPAAEHGRERHGERGGAAVEPIWIPVV